jgi:predicted DCC family thiol-disulfide oxidoreductase YuxK
VAWLRARDRRGALRFEPLQGPAAAPWCAVAGPGLDTLVVVARGPDGERILTRSAAVLAALRAIGGGWGLLSLILSLAPRPFADATYRAVARRRHPGSGLLGGLP